MILLFHVFPIAMTNVWLLYGLKQNVVNQIIPHRATFNDDGLIIKYFESEKFSKIPPEEFYATSQIVDMEETNRFLIFYMGNKCDDLVMIPKASIIQNSSQ